MSIEAIKKEAVDRARRAHATKLDDIIETCDKLGHALIWVQENLPERNLINNGFDSWGFPGLTIACDTVDEAKSIIAQMVKACNLKIRKRPDFDNLSTLSFTWRVACVDGGRGLEVRFLPRHCRMVETGEVKEVPVRKVVCFEDEDDA